MSGSVLETFWLLFDSDASKVKKGAEEAEVAASGLNSKLLSVDEISAHLGSSFLGMAKQAAEAFAAMFAVEKLIGGAFENAEFAKHVGESAEALGISTSALGAWGDAVRHIGGDAEGAISSFKALSGSLAQVDATGHSRVKPFFDELGIQMLDIHGKIKPVNDLLLEMAGKFEHMSKQESFGFGRKMQLDEGMIRLLQRGSSGVQSLIDKMHGLGDITDQDAEAAKKWDESLDTARLTLRHFGLSITSDVLPQLAELVDWFSDNGPVIEDTLGTITAAIVLLTAKMVIMKGVAIASVAITEIGEVIAWLELLTTAFETAAVAEWLLMAPWLLIVAAIGLVSYAVYELWKNWSGIGDKFIDKINQIKEAFGGLGDWINKLLGGNGEFNVNKHLTADHVVSAAQSKLATMNSTPLASQNSQSIMNGSKNYNSSNSLSIGTILVQTQATDAKEIAAQIHSAIKDEHNKQSRQTVNAWANGVAG